MVRSLTESLDNFYTTTWQMMKDNVADQVFDGTPFFYWLKDKGKLKTQAGFRYFTEPLRYAKAETSWLGRGGSVALNDYEFLTTSQYPWRYLVGSLVRFGVDDQQNRGKAKIIDFAESKLENMKDSLKDQLETSLFARTLDTTGSIEMYGLQDMVPDDPTENKEFAGINGSTYTWWQNSQTDMTGRSYAAYGQSDLRSLMNTVALGNQNSRPDLILSGQTPFEYLEDSTLEQKRIVNQKLGDAGFENIQFKGVPAVWSPACANTRQYVLNTNFMNLVYDPMMYFEMTEWKPIPDQVMDRAAQIVLACQLTTNRRRAFGVLHSIDTP